MSFVFCFFFFIFLYDCKFLNVCDVNVIQRHGRRPDALTNRLNARKQIAPFMHLWSGNPFKVSLCHFRYRGNKICVPTKRMRRYKT